MSQKSRFKRDEIRLKRTVTPFKTGFQVNDCSNLILVVCFLSYS